jgi:hypothetical protein
MTRRDRPFIFTTRKKTLGFTGVSGVKFLLLINNELGHQG